jgi:hypothetical protein
MPFPPISEIWKLTKKGKIVPRPDRECPKCYTVGKIVDTFPFKRNLRITRHCPNPDCGWEWGYYHSWNQYTKRELKEFKKWVEKNRELLSGHAYRVAEEKLNELLGKHPE